MLLESQKRCCYLKNVALDFVLLVLKLCPIQFVISLPLWIKLTMDQSFFVFLFNFSSFFSYVVGILVINLFSLLLINRYILAIQQIITHKEHLRYSFWCTAVFWKKNNRKWLKQPQGHFYWAVPSKSGHFSLFWCMLCTATPDISSSSENINSTARVSRQSFRFLWLLLYCGLWISYIIMTHFVYINTQKWFI